MKLQAKLPRRRERAFGAALVLGALALAGLGFVQDRAMTPAELERLEARQVADTQRAFGLVARRVPRAELLRSDAEVLAEVHPGPLHVADAE
ncbi:MAG: hypothetical protein P1V81_04910 [Planctomycetota bacterium]|nr:hypothetical protein [Planctomycetota bacterium]